MSRSGKRASVLWLGFSHERIALMKDASRDTSLLSTTESVPQIRIPFGDEDVSRRKIFDAPDESRTVSRRSAASLGSVHKRADLVCDAAYLMIFSEWMPQSIRDYVDAKQ